MGTVLLLFSKLPSDSSIFKNCSSLGVFDLIGACEAVKLETDNSSEKEFFSLSSKEFVKESKGKAPNQYDEGEY